MMVLCFAWESHEWQGANSAAVCSRPPSGVGVGEGRAVRGVLGWVRGRK